MLTIAFVHWFRYPCFVTAPSPFSCFRRSFELDRYWGEVATKPADWSCLASTLAEQSYRWIAERFVVGRSAVERFVRSSGFHSQTSAAVIAVVATCQLGSSNRWSLAFSVEHFRSMVVVVVVVVKIRLAVDDHFAAKSHLAAECCSENSRPVAESSAVKNLPELGNRPVSNRVARILVVESLAEESLVVNTLVVIETLTND